MKQRKPTDRQRKIDSGERVEVGLAVIKQEDGYALCSCGQPFTQPRLKVREDAIDRHLERKHQGRGIRL